MFKRRGLTLVALIRIAYLPISFGLACYLLSITSVSLLDYTLGSCFVLFHVVLWSILGCMIYASTDNSTPEVDHDTHIFVIIILIIFTVILAIFVACWAKKEFDKEY